MVNSMDSRMNKYDNNIDNSGESNISMSRTQRNTNVYASLDMNDLSRIRTNNNVSVISEDPREMDLEKIRNYINQKNENEYNMSRRKVVLDIPKEEDVKIERIERKDYDINSVLERAKEKKESDYEDIRYRKFNNTEYDILKKLSVEEHEKENTNDKISEEEKTIIELLNNFQENKNNSKKEELFSDLMGDNEDTQVLPIMKEEMSVEEIQKELNNMTRELNDLKKPLEELSEQFKEEKKELEKLEKEYYNNIDKEKEENAPKIEKIEVPTETTKMSNIDKSFFTNSISFSKTDFESFDELNEKDNSTALKLAIIIVILIILAATFYILNKIFNIF